MAGLADREREGVHQGQRLRHQTPGRRMAVAEHEELHGERVAIALARAADIVARHKPLQHAIDLARSFSHRLHDLGPGQPARLLGQQLQYVQPLVERRGAVELFLVGRRLRVPGHRVSSQRVTVAFSISVYMRIIYSYMDRQHKLFAWEERRSCRIPRTRPVLSSRPGSRHKRRRSTAMP